VNLLAALTLIGIRVSPRRVPRVLRNYRSRRCGCLLEEIRAGDAGNTLRRAREGRHAVFPRTQTPRPDLSRREDGIDKRRSGTRKDVYRRTVSECSIFVAAEGSCQREISASPSGGPDCGAEEYSASVFKISGHELGALVRNAWRRSLMNGGGQGGGGVLRHDTGVRRPAVSALYREKRRRHLREIGRLISVGPQTAMGLSIRKSSGPAFATTIRSRWSELQDEPKAPSRAMAALGCRRPQV